MTNKKCLFCIYWGEKKTNEPVQYCEKMKHNTHKGFYCGYFKSINDIGESAFQNATGNS